MPDTYVEVLKILAKDAFAAPEHIGKMLGIQPAEVKKIIEELEKTKMILGYKAVVNKEKVFEDKVFAVIEVHVTPERDEGFERISRRIYRFPEVRSLYLVSGDYDFILFVEGETLREIADFVSRKLSTVDGIRQTATHFMLKTYKEDGIMLEEQEKSERLKVTP